jgi:thiosulfate dehydrogenase [quinone] large subunit
MTSLTASFRNQQWSVRILRVWLGYTFIYAGWNKASDRSFFDPKSFQYIGHQLTGFAHGSPIGALLRLAADHAVLVGWLTLLSEFAIGIATLLNVAPISFAVAGGFLSLTLWLSASWRIHPYFLASDPAYFAMWSAYAVALLAKKPRVRIRPMDLERRGVMRIAAVAVLAVLGALLGRFFQTSPKAVRKEVGTNANFLVALTTLPVGSAHNFITASGDPAVVIRMGNNSVSAFDAICTHQGCQVAYDPALKTLLCPCHGSQYDPLTHATVITGPAPRPLTEIKVKIEGANVVLA